MNYRYLVSNTFNSSYVTKTGTLNGVPVYSNLVSRVGDTKEYNVVVTRGFPDRLNLNSSNSIALSLIRDDDLLRSIIQSQDEDDIIPLSQQFDFKTGLSFNRYDLNKELIQKYDEGLTLWDLLNDNDYISKLELIAEEMFCSINPLTNKPDLDSIEFYTKFIPLVSLTGVIPPQLDKENNCYFNPNGTVMVSEFLDSLNAINYGSNSNTNRKKSKDSVSEENDFFNEGYNNCLVTMSSPFYKLYTRKELMKPITRLELAYITVLCWGSFINKFENVYSGKYDLGININWRNPAKYISKFNDIFEIKVSEVLNKISNKDYTSLDVKDYKCSLSMSEFKEEIKAGKRPIPLPMLMCLLELDALDLFYFKDSKLSPLKEVSRGELTYFLTKLAKEFPTKFISSGDNTY